MSHPLGITTKSPYSLANAQEAANTLYGKTIDKMKHDKPNQVLLVWLHTPA
jgi:hypothetical protein